MMSRSFIVLSITTLVAAVLGTNSALGLVINEFWADDTGADDVEYIELFGNPNESLDGLSLIIVDGDTGGGTGTNFRRVTMQIDFGSLDMIPADRYYVAGDGLGAIADFSPLPDDIQNGSQTFALVRTIDIEFDLSDIDELTASSIANITANLIDAIAVIDDGVGDISYFGAPILGPNTTGGAWDTGSRIPNGLDTDSISDWAVQANGGSPPSIELGDPQDRLSTPGAQNRLLPEPTSLALLLLGLSSSVFCRRSRK